MVVAACASEASTGTRLVGDVHSVRAVDVAEPERGESVAQLNETSVVVTYWSGSCGSTPEAPLLPKELRVTFHDDEVVVEVDSSVDCDTRDDIAVLRATELELSQAIEGRSVRVVRLPR